MPSLIATLGADASNFNRVLEGAQRKASQVGKKMTVTGGGLASNPNAFYRDALTEKQPQKTGLSRKERIAREAAEARRLDAIEKDNARSWMAQQRDQMAMFRHSEAEKRAQRKLTERESIEDNKRWVEQQKRGIKESAAVNKQFAKERQGSALVGASKMFAGFMSVDFIARQTKQTVDYAREVDRLSKSLNMSAEDVQAWDKVGQKHGLTLDNVGALLKSINKNRMNALNGNEPLQAEAFKTLGISGDMLKTMSASGLAQQIGKAFESGENTEQLTAALMRVGEESSFAFTAAFQEGISKNLDQVRASGEVMTNETVTRLKLIGEQWVDLGSKLKGAFGSMLSPILRFLTAVVELRVALTESIGEFGRGIGSKLFSNPGEALEAGKNAFMKVWEDRQKKAEERDKKVAEAAKPFVPKPINLEQNDAKEKEKEKKLLDSAKKKQEREAEEAAKMGKHSVGSLQQMGGFLGNFAAAAGPEVAAATATIRSERHLADILKELRKKSNGGGGTSEETEY